MHTEHLIGRHPEECGELSQREQMTQKWERRHVLRSHLKPKPRFWAHALAMTAAKQTHSLDRMECFFLRVLVITVCRGRKDKYPQIMPTAIHQWEKAGQQ